MSIKKRISLRELKIQSFVTTLEEPGKIMAGETKEPCTNNDCTIYVNCYLPPA
jgi:hypothetical protein